jgi:hypothetical protein
LKKLLFKLLSKVSQSTVDEYITQRWIKPLDFKELSLAFVDTTGKSWYEYPDGLGNPMKRMAANLQAYEYLTARMSPEMFDAAVVDINTALAHGKVVEAGAILTRLKSLKDEVIPVDVLINLIATDLVREDENPKDHNAAIHQEKCDYLKEAIDKGEMFFFRLTVVKDLSKRFKISNEGWTTILKGFQEAVKEAKRERDILLSMNSDKE